jgi:hypothetical protein
MVGLRIMARGRTVLDGSCFFPVPLRLHDLESDGSVNDLAPNLSGGFEPLELAVDRRTCSVRPGTQRFRDFMPADASVPVDQIENRVTDIAGTGI